jgi:hypothetical protein
MQHVNFNKAKTRGATSRYIKLELPVLQAESHAVTQQRVTLHLSETNASVFLTALHGLPGDGGDRARATHLRFVTHHVSARASTQEQRRKEHNGEQNINYKIK